MTVEAGEKAMVEVRAIDPLSSDGIEEAFKTLNDGKMRYRAVLTA